MSFWIGKPDSKLQPHNHRNIYQLPLSSSIFIKNNLDQQETPSKILVFVLEMILKHVYIDLAFF